MHGPVPLICRARTHKALLTEGGRVSVEGPFELIAEPEEGVVLEDDADLGSDEKLI